MTLTKIHVLLWKCKQTIIQKLNNVKYKKELVELSKFQNKYAGERCFVIGTGPSLTADDLNMLKDEYTFASNSIFRYLDKTDWKPNFYSVCDKTYYLANKENIDSVEVKNQKFFPLDFALNFGFHKDFRYYLRTPYSVRHPRFRDDPMHAFQEGSTITYHLLQLAVMMGFSEIYLLGIDFNYSLSVDNKGNIIRNDAVKDYAFNDKAANYTMPNLEASYYSYCSAEEYCKEHNYKPRIYNATRGGKLEVFKRVDFDSLFGENKL